MTSTNGTNNNQNNKASHAATKFKNKDAFMTDAIQLIGVIYKYAKLRGIPGPQFERIIANSYDYAWQLESKGKG